VRRALALLVVALAAVPAFAAAPVRLDDAASPRSRFDVKPRWLYREEGLSDPARLNAMVAEVPHFEVRLNTARYVGKSGRVYLVVPDFVSGLRGATGFRAEWRARGPLLSGSAIPGARALVYDGKIATPVLADILDLTLQIDARFVDAGLRFEPRFEIEIDP
jgi:hypothetical protein